MRGLIIIAAAYSVAALVGMALFVLWRAMLPTLGGFEGIICGVIVVVPTSLILERIID